MDGRFPVSDGDWAGEIPAGVSLRAELSLRGLAYAAGHGLLHERTDGQTPSILFGRDEEGRHGNFHQESYRMICASPGWAKRLEKVHTAYRRMRVRANWCWKELDCSNSSDALLMNIFCYPGMVGSLPVQGLLGIDGTEDPVFGFRPRTPLGNGRCDATEIDMRLGRLLVEAKLTESHFQLADARLLLRYRDFEEAFYLDELPRQDQRYVGYQLIRGALAAYADGLDFCVFCDARRPDLVESWYRVMRAVRGHELRCRLKLLTWQELAGALPEALQEFVEVKYGILAR